VAQLSGELDTFDRRIQALLDAAQERGFVYYSGAGQAFRGWTRAVSGNLADGILELETGIQAQLGIGATILSAYLLGLLADALDRAGQDADAIDRLEAALSQNARTGERWFEAELLRRRAALLLKSNRDSSGAEATLLQALELARAQGAKPRITAISQWSAGSDGAAISALGKLFEDRDLQPTRDLRSVVKGILAEHLDLSLLALDQVFPDSRAAQATHGLIRT